MESGIIQVHVELLVAAVGLLLTANGAILTFIAHLGLRMFNEVLDIKRQMAIDRAVRENQQ